MEVPDLHLAEISFKEPPTKAQTTNALRDISKFLNNVTCALITSGTFYPNEPHCGEIFNSASKLRLCAEAIEKGPLSDSGLLLPQGMQGPQAVPIMRR
jgi:hypothetical protein